MLRKNVYSFIAQSKNNAVGAWKKKESFVANVNLCTYLFLSSMRRWHGINLCKYRSSGLYQLMLMNLVVLIFVKESSPLGTLTKKKSVLQSSKRPNLQNCSVNMFPATTWIADRVTKH